MATAAAPRITLAQIDTIKRHGGQVDYNVDGELVVTYPRSAVSEFVREILDEAFGHGRQA